MTTPRPHAELAARNAAVIWLYQRAADQACINARYPKHVARYPGWVKSQQTMESLAQCWSNPIKNAWGQEVNTTKLNAAHAFASRVLAGQEAPLAEDAARWRFSVADGGNQRMSWLDVYDDWDGDGDFTAAIDAARAQQEEPS